MPASNACELDQVAAEPQPTVLASFPIVELRQYTLHPGQRDTLVELFEREFLDTQEAEGIKVIGTFRDLDRPDRFVWLRGFSDMDSRLAGLSAFYGGPHWQAHRDAANATMIDSDNVLLLRAPDNSAEFELDAPRPAPGEQAPAGLVVATILYLSRSSAAAEVFERQVKPSLAADGVPVLAWFVPETSANNFPRLPVREGEEVLVWFAAFSSAADHAAQRAVIADALSPLAPFLRSEPEVLRLEPTARSQLRGVPAAARGSAGDFDFLIGRWSVQHRKLDERGVGSTDWRTYSGTAETRALLGGLCNVEEHRIDGHAASGVALRCFDRASARWAIYWVSERAGRVEPPVYGGFSGDEGIFEGADCDGGRLVKVRFLWRRIGEAAAHWEQSFSYDEGRSWECNWVMEFSRLG
jgi:quinol monooxygenase YgiN